MARKRKKKNIYKQPTQETASDLLESNAKVYDIPQEIIDMVSSQNENTPPEQNTTPEFTETSHANEQTPPPEAPSAKPEVATETSGFAESHQTPHNNTPSGSSYDFNNAKQNMRDEIFGVKEDKEKGIEAKQGIEAEHKFLTDPERRESRRSSMQNEDVVSIKRFNRAREYYKQNMDRIQAIDKHLNNARATFSEQEQEQLLSNKNIKNINKALNEAKAEYDSAVLDAKRAGNKVFFSNEAS